MTGELAELRGQFLLTKSDSNSNYLEWHPITTFKACGEIINFKDFDIQSGTTYKYGLQQFNDHGVYSYKIYSDLTLGQLDHMYLYDGERQLKIKFNPQISSFKSTLMETKLNAMGNKFPTFFRNGIVNYKEFPLSGLISYWSDEEELFMTHKELGLIEENYPTINLTDYNIEAEKRFKLKALEFLNNGKPKLFKSNAEGNYIVRLMNS